MRLSTAFDSQLRDELASKAKLQVGVVRNYNSRARTLDLETVEGGTTTLYTGVVVPSFGSGFRPATIKENTYVVFGFIGESRDIPVVISILTGNGISSSEAADVSIVGRVGRLFMGQHV